MDRGFDRDQKGLERALKTLDSHFAQSDAILQVRQIFSLSSSPHWVGCRNRWFFPCGIGILTRSRLDALTCHFSMCNLFAKRHRRVGMLLQCHSQFERLGVKLKLVRILFGVYFTRIPHILCNHYTQSDAILDVTNFLLPSFVSLPQMNSRRICAPGVLF